MADLSPGFIPGLEEDLKDRNSFRRFVGLSFTDQTPDETAFVRFRDRLRRAGLHDTIFDAVVKHIEDQGLLVRQGTMVDATIIEAPRGRPRPDGTTTRDQDASFTQKHGVPHHGYKGHIAADMSGIVTDYRFGTAKEHDSRHIDDLTLGERRLVLADSAYASRARRAEVRARAEHPSAMLKHHLGCRRVRYRGRERDAFNFALTMTACNIKRSLSLIRKAGWRPRPPRRPLARRGDQAADDPATAAVIMLPRGQ